MRGKGCGVRKAGKREGDRQRKGGKEQCEAKGVE